MNDTDSDARHCRAVIGFERVRHSEQEFEEDPKHALSDSV
jgi:hypothetical protein